tara:strand:- start:46 stop:924 length:879 start_codon:yes stop_codon:yes gene_type:complete
MPGIRIEDEIQFAGIRRNEFSISYPSRRLNFPIYPYIKIINSYYPFKLYSVEGYQGSYTHSSNVISSGIGLLLKNYWNTEFEYFWKENDFQSEDKQDIFNVDYNEKAFLGIRIRAQLDLLNDVLLPKRGIFINGKYENSLTELGSSQDYEFYQAQGKIYKTFHLNTYGISAYYHRGTKETPLYMTTKYEGSQIFAGTKEFQVHGSSLAFSQLEYRYKHKKDIFAHLIVNWLISAKSENSNYTAKNIWGVGTGITFFFPPVGPLKFTWSWGPKNIYTNKNWQSLFHFSAGYKF